MRVSTRTVVSAISRWWLVPIAFVAGLGLSQALPVGRSVDAVAQCATGGLNWSVADSVAFTNMGSSTLQALPFGGMAGSNPWAQHFVLGETVGYINRKALNAPYRSELDQAARISGYQVGEWPLVPLAGQIVVDTPGMLEVYLTVFVFDSADTASSYIRAASLEGGMPYNVTVDGVPVAAQYRDVSELGDEAIAIDGPAAANPQVEHEGAVDVRIGRTVLLVTIRGGSSVRSSDAVDISGPEVQTLRECR